MSNERSPDEMFSSGQMPEAEAKAKAVDVAETVANNIGGFWHWIDDTRIRVYRENGDLFSTVHVEKIQ